MLGVRNGCREDMRNGRNGDSAPDAAAWGIDMFIEDGAYTTLTSAVCLLMVVALLFSSAGAVWLVARSGDVQVAADVSSLAGSNVVASYETCATAIDASALSMGLSGFVLAGVGLVGLLIPGVAPAARGLIDTAAHMLEVRDSFVASASKGLRRLEGALPFLVAANASHTCAGQNVHDHVYTGTALAFPRESASEFPALDAPSIHLDELQGDAQNLDEAAGEMKRAAEKAADRKERAWLADCGNEGRNMQERAAALTDMPPLDNPDYASSITWNPAVALDRIRRYYDWRLAHNAPDGSGVEAQADAAARRVFYGYAKRQFAGARIEEKDGRCVVELPDLPKNARETRKTELYTQEIWPTTLEGGDRTLHFSGTCPGARGVTAGNAALSSIESGVVRECSVCRFGVGDVGKVAAASSAIDNGFEYHLNEFTRAMRDYEVARNEQLACGGEAQGRAEEAGDAFDRALDGLETARPKIAPPGRYGCVAAVVAAPRAAPERLESPFAAQRGKSRTYAISASVAAPDRSSSKANVLSSFAAGIGEKWEGGAIGLVDGAFDVWGKLLSSYGDVSEGLERQLDEALGGLERMGAGPVAKWLDDRVRSVMGSLDIGPVDLASRKAVLVDSARVLARAGWKGAELQRALRELPPDVGDPGDLARALGYEIGERIESGEIVLAEIPLPGGGSIPISVTLGDVFGSAAST